MKLYKLLYKYKTRAIFLSGDVHSAEFLYHPCSDVFLGYPMIEFTSSGLTELYDSTGGYVPMILFEKTLNNFVYANTFNKP